MPSQTYQLLNIAKPQFLKMDIRHHQTAGGNRHPHQDPIESGGGSAKVGIQQLEGV